MIPSQRDRTTNCATNDAGDALCSRCDCDLLEPGRHAQLDVFDGYVCLDVIGCQMRQDEAR